MCREFIFFVLKEIVMMKEKCLFLVAVTYIFKIIIMVAEVLTVVKSQIGAMCDMIGNPHKRIWAIRCIYTVSSSSPYAS